VRSSKRLGIRHSSYFSVIGDAAVLSFESGGEYADAERASSSRAESMSPLRYLPVVGPRLIRCNVFGPDGSMLPVYSRNWLLDNSATTFVLPSALNDLAGRTLSEQ